MKISGFVCLLCYLTVSIRRDTLFCGIFSSPEPKAPGELIGWEGSVVRHPSSVRPSVRPQFQTTSPLKLLGRLIATKFHIQLSGPLGKKSCSNGLGHMTNMAAMPIYDKNLKKSSSPEPLDR